MCDLPQCASLIVEVPMTEPNQMFNIYGESLWIVPRYRYTVEGGGGVTAFVGPASYQHLIACGHDVDDVVAYLDIWNREEREAWLDTLTWPEVER
jgi:hypothetical protein